MKITKPLRLKREPWKLKPDYILEYLPDDFIVYTDSRRSNYMVHAMDGIPAKQAFTDCCDAKPLMYRPYPDSFPDTWWLICAGCNSAIKHNGSTL